MPGIVGMINNRPVEHCERLVAAMVRSMEHEPSYTAGTYFVPELGVYVGWVAHKSSFAAGQVFFNEQRDIALVLSGECFVDQEVHSALKRKGHRLEGAHSWLVHLYEEDGEQFVEKLNGLFSGLLIDERQRKVVLFNDRCGRLSTGSAKRGNIFCLKSGSLSLPFQLRSFNRLFRKPLRGCCPGTLNLRQKSAFP